MSWTAALPAFLASMVEFVEALTIVLAIGVSINWRSALTGALAAAAALTVLALFGTTLIAAVPLPVLRLVIGLLLVLFGAQWLRKALLRYAGLKAFRNEAALFEKQVKKAEESADRSRFSPYGFLASFKSVLLEGLEVAFIVVTFGSTASGPRSETMAAAAAGALGALVAVVLLGLLLHKPLTKVPENLLKFSVGWMLLTFGLFWAGEGLGIEWPGADLFLLVLGALTLGLCAGLLTVLRGRKIRGWVAQAEGQPPRNPWLRAPFEVFDFFCGDVRMAAGTAVVTIATVVSGVPMVVFLGGMTVVFGFAMLKASARPA